MDQQQKGENLGDATKKNVCRHHNSKDSGLQTDCDICKNVSLFYIIIDMWVEIFSFLDFLSGLKIIR